MHGRVANGPPNRAAREREFDAVIEPRRVNLSPENRFEASPLAGIPLPPGLSGVTFGVLVRSQRWLRQRLRCCPLLTHALAGNQVTRVDVPTRATYQKII